MLFLPTQTERYETKTVIVSPMPALPRWHAARRARAVRWSKGAVVAGLRHKIVRPIGTVLRQLAEGIY